MDLASLLNVAGRFPLPMLYALGYVLHLGAHDVAKFRRSLVFRNVSRSFPDLTREEVLSVSRRSYRNLAEVLAESVKASRLAPEDIRQRVIMQDMEPIHRLVAEGRSVVLLAAHHCNWEWLLLATCLELSVPLVVPYHPTQSKGLDAFLTAARSRFGAVPVPAPRFTDELLARRRRRHAFALLADQTPSRTEPRYWTTFLGQRTAFFPGPEATARVTDAPAFFVRMQRVQRGHYRAWPIHLASPPYPKTRGDILEAYVRELERQIRDAPADWLWIYRKWKHRADNGSDCSPQRE